MSIGYKRGGRALHEENENITDSSMKWLKCSEKQEANASPGNFKQQWVELSEMMQCGVNLWQQNTELTAFGEGTEGCTYNPTLVSSFWNTVWHHVLNSTGCKKQSRKHHKCWSIFVAIYFFSVGQCYSKAWGKWSQTSSLAPSWTPVQT